MSEGKYNPSDILTKALGWGQFFAISTTIVILESGDYYRQTFPYGHQGH